MNAPVPIELLVALLLGSAVLAGSLRLVLRARAGNPGTGRCIVLLALQATATVLLYLVLFPPPELRDAGVLTVLAERGDAGGQSGLAVALPEHAGSGIERVPDLATALRRHPDTTRIIVRGTSLPWRDHEAAHRVDVHFEPVSMPAGLVELQLPPALVAGQRLQLRGRVAGVERSVLELVDPGGRRLSRLAADADGRFQLPLTAQAAGVVEFALRVMDADGRIVDEAPVAVSIRETAATRILLLAGAPSAELRELRRWATDAGIEMESRIRLSRDASLGDQPRFSADELEAFDLMLIDLRSWRTFDAAQRHALREAIDGGLGVLLRMDDTPAAEDLPSLQTLGFDVHPVEPDDIGVQLHPEHVGQSQRGGSEAEASQSDTAPRMRQRPVRVDAGDAAVLVRSDTGQPLALWRSSGVGRVALWWLDDTYPLVRLAEPLVHANLWSQVVSTLSRARDAAAIDTGLDAGVSTRRVLCGLGEHAHVTTPNGGRSELVVDHRGCAGFWPERPGWHAVQAEGRREPFHVGAPTALQAHAAREATHRLAARPWRSASTGQLPAPGSPWPWFLAFVAIAGVLWWLERPRPTATAIGAGDREP